MRVFVTVIFLLLLSYALGFLVFVGNLPTRPGLLPKADAIVALTGGDGRVDTAVALLEKGVGKRLLVSGASEATTKQMLGRISGGGPRFACCADIGYSAEDTHGNAEEAADWARTHHFHSLVIVTGRQHMPRTLSEFSAVMPDIALIAYPVAQSNIDLKGWWRHPRTTQLLNREYVKYLASLVMTHLARAG